MLRGSITLDEIVEVTGGALVDGPSVAPGASGDEAVTSVSTDTRTLVPGALFVALRGENHDAHDYLVQAREKGAVALLVDRALTLEEAKLPHVVVPDTTQALGDIARYVRDAFKGPIVGVTGSLGKTTTKEMLATVLGAAFSVHKSEANHNNEIGVPQTLFALTESHTAAVVEMGMRGAGQIRRLCEIAAPTIGVITGIGTSHIELLGSRENIAGAKGELFEMLPTNGIAVYPAGDAFAADLAARFAGEKITVAVEGGEGGAVSDSSPTVTAREVARHENGYRFTVTSPWGTQKFFVNSPGDFNVLNALFAIAVAARLGIPLGSVAKALLRWQPPAMRLEPVQSSNGITILSDAYNAAPDSMVGALRALKDTPLGLAGGKRIAVLGEMKELGTYTDEGHTLVGRAAARIAVPDMLILVGEKPRRIAAGALVEGFERDKIHSFETTEEAARVVPLIVQPGDVVLVKGSRAMKMEQIVAALGKKYGGETVDREARPAPPAPVTPPDATPPSLAPSAAGGAAAGGAVEPSLYQRAPLELDDLPPHPEAPGAKTNGDEGGAP